VTHFPARHYFINVWDHGSGWHALRLKSSSPGTFHPSDISWDDQTGNSISTHQLAQALKEASKIIGHPVDLYASDACLMGMIEIASQVSQDVQIYAGSEEVEAGEGWPYDAILERWARKPQLSAAEVGQLLTEEFVQSYREGSQNDPQNATFAAYDLGKMNAVEQGLQELTEELLYLSPSDQAEVLHLAHEAQSFTYSDYRDLTDFVRLLRRSSLTALNQPKLQALETALGEMILAHDATPGYERALGMSIWLPTSLSLYQKHIATYQTLSFHQKTSWGKLLSALLTHPETKSQEK
ncbi:MAG: clostripain-related cysteine peptidase, partial [Bdellovibrionia bacterium]